ncbi:DUF4845 domain-containing protein [Ectothiorhodospira lacustris]|uniref:DUF4845 domain-containing protein n=1 Tax=Ectothiorhodospira lacustris TaxID=2899127 RepID=UPI001EE877AF|nr:DUF4845 domain-containing protein [Ectothiorhodospira lacustris]MCG5500529.1 DUF4845 domain-containing protein [Ectothiorhodospira lacustris]MCG5509398.1 DUF4845 domain-containing protein [Ectothiorhodospira lacustris]MCG5521452.1 DUF4845 domain-containing protein [Ectothiorhodospira lacustris]
MNRMNRQSGIGLIGFLVIVGLLVVIGTVGLRLFPVYTQYMTVISVMKDVSAESGAAGKNIRVLWGEMDRRFQINGVTHVTRDDVTIVEQGGVRSLRVSYEVRTPMIANVDAVVGFDRSFTLSE